MNWTWIDQDNFNFQDLDAVASAAKLAPVSQDNTAVDLEFLNDMDVIDLA